MIIPSSLLNLSFVFLLATLPHVVLALTNVTVSYNSSSIHYKPNSSVWFTSDSSLDYSQSHTTTTTKGASANFTFTGVAIYYAAASWPYPVSANISLNGGSGTFVDLHDYQSAQANGGSASASATIHWYREGLQNTTHTIVISLANNATYAVLDTLIYTIDDGDDGSDNTDDSHSTWPIILGSVLGGLVLIGAIVGSALVYRRRQKKKNEKPIWDAPILENLMTPLVTSQAAETHPLVSSKFANSRHTLYPSRSSGSQSQNLDSTFATELSEHGRYSDHMSAFTPQFVEGSSRSRVGSQVVAGVDYTDEKKRSRSNMVLSVTDLEAEELPPPAYSEHHEH
ncbi:hypothetical protein F5050DRAFT_1728190 [Lentinula boryana]|uniref:Uncharacterized protein n=1 Tax=Lentinula boryana TaxID=40481 RepID=A0ABQ8QR32_9AGAR|nr:hypothetical protein F5050DRAFT_1728190 [Lentinula boryana]